MLDDRWIEVNGVCLRYRLEGDGGRTLVLVHEMGGCVESWDAVVAELAGDYRILRYDQRGFGFSEKRHDLSLVTTVADLEALLAALGIDEPVDLAGAALGASICLGFALAHPELTGKLVLSSPATGGTGAAARERILEWIREADSAGVRAVTDAMFAVTYPPEIDVAAEARDQHRLRWLSMSPASYGAICHVLLDLALQPHLHEVRAATLVLGCTHDRIRPAAASAAIAAAIPTSQYAEIESGHYLPLQHPELFAARLRGFLAPGQVSRTGMDTR